MFRVFKVVDGKKNLMCTSHYKEEAERVLVDVICKSFPEFDKSDTNTIFGVMDKRYENFENGSVYMSEKGKVPEGVKYQ